MLKKSAIFVLTSLDGHFEHPASRLSDITLRKVMVDFEQKPSFPAAC